MPKILLSSLATTSSMIPPSRTRARIFGYFFGFPIQPISIFYNFVRNEDCSAWRDEFLLPKYVLEDDYESAYNLMAKVGDNNGVLTATAYRDWPIFKEIRKETKFSDLFHEIFGEQLRENVNVGNEKMINEENVANKEVQ